MLQPSDGEPCGQAPAERDASAGGGLAVMRFRWEVLLDDLYAWRKFGIREGNLRKHRGDTAWWDAERGCPRETWWACKTGHFGRVRYHVWRVREALWIATHSRQHAQNLREIESVIRDAQAIYGRR